MKAKTILVIEDNKVNMKLMKEILKFGQYKALGAEDAETGIDLANKYRPDLILMDIQLPGMDGLSATQFLKEKSETKNIPVIAVTALSTQDIKERAIQVGCVDFLPKPISVQTILESIKQCLK